MEGKSLTLKSQALSVFDDDSPEEAKWEKPFTLKNQPPKGGKKRNVKTETRNSGMK
jgi:hypothetical protein